MANENPPNTVFHKQAIQGQAGVFIPFWPLQDYFETQWEMLVKNQLQQHLIYNYIKEGWSVRGEGKVEN